MGRTEMVAERIARRAAGHPVKPTTPARPRRPMATRKPTGRVPWPFVLIEGPEKSGKSWAAAMLSASERVGRTLWFDLGEGAGDEYGAIPGVRYELVELDGTWHDLVDQVDNARDIAAAELAAGNPPTVVVLDSGTAEWAMLTGWAHDRAARSERNRTILAGDPDAEIVIPMNIWNDVNKRHRQLMTKLLTFPGIVVVTARGKWVAAVGENGRPIEGRREYRVEGQKDLAFDASLWVRLSREGPAVVVGARSVHAGIMPGRDKPRQLPPDWTLERLIFDVLKLDPATAHVRDLVELAEPAPTPASRPETVDVAGDAQTLVGDLRRAITAAKDGDDPWSGIEVKRPPAPAPTDAEQSTGGEQS